jgi:outer membrane protein OmpA-like peptidoglycan-associated protein
VGTTGSNPVSFDAFDVDAGRQVLFTYQTRVGTGVADGKHRNIVTLTPPVGPTLDATATVNVDAENGDPMFESTTIIGKVFDDRKPDGWQEDGEPGIAGVRLATVSGLTVETDRYGRFHIADVPVSRFDRGANFIIKVDESTLPDGASVTSENPRVIRLTQGTMSKVNFAVDVPGNAVPQRTWDCIESCVTYMPRTAMADIEPVLFESGESVIPADYEAKLKEVLVDYQGKRNVNLRFVGHTDTNPVYGQLALDLGAEGAAGNLILSENRAREVCEHVENNFDVPVDCTRIEGKGQTVEAATNATPEGRAKNRRVEIEVEFLEITSSFTYEKVDYQLCEISGIPEIPGFWLSDGPESPIGPEPVLECGLHKQYFQPKSADATDIRISGGLFGCNQLVDPDFGGQSGGLRPRERELTANSSEYGDDNFDPDNCTFTPYYEENCLTETAIGAAPGQYPVEIRTCAGSVLRVTENGDVQRAGFPDNNERIVVTPFRDETDNSKISAFRIINEGIERGADSYDQSEDVAATNTNAWVSTDPFIMDPRLDVLTTDHVIADSQGNLLGEVNFAVYTNYAKFIDDYVIELFGRAGPGFDRKFLGTIPADVPRETYAFDRPFTLTPGAFDLTGLNSIEYVVRARKGCAAGQDGRCFEDRTEPRVLTVQREESAMTQPLARDEVWGMSNLAQQNIPIVGDRVRVHGTHAGPENNLWVDEALRSLTDSPIRSYFVPIGPDRKFALEQYMPIGRYRFSVRKDFRDPNLHEIISADAHDIRVSGGLFGCRVLAGAVLPGRADEEDGQILALTVVGDHIDRKAVTATSATDCPEGFLPGVPPVLIETREGTRIEINSTGDVVYSTYPGPLNNQQIVVTPFRDYTDSSLVSALRIENEGVESRLIRNDLPGFAFNVEVAESEGFLVALANVTVGENSVSGNIAPLAADDHFDGTVFTDGRMAMYAKGKIQGKYLVTAQLDTTEDELSNMGDNLRRRDPRRLFRQLDPDRYYAVYGDDSTSTTDVDTQGAFYLRVDWDRNTALWGNFNTGMTDTEFAQYNRTLYGAAFKHESQETTLSGDADNELTVFASEAQSVPAHVTFKATGGSLYYLRDTDIVMGSEKAWIEVRRRDSQQVVEKQVLIEGRDYEVDALQGRIILSQPLSQVVQERQSSIIRSTPLEGDEVYLLVDYEYVPEAFVADDMVLGARGKKWLGDHVGIGGTAVTDRRGATDYDLEGLDIVVKGPEGTYLSAEFARSEARQSDANSISFDGGLSFQSQISANPGDSLEGDAIALDGRLNLADLGVIEGLDGVIHGWWKSRDAEFSTGRLGQGIDVTDSGIEIQAKILDFMTISADHTQLEQAQISTQKVTRLKAEGKGERLSLGVEVRHEEVEQLVPGQFGPVTGLRGVIGDGEALLMGARVGYDLDNETTIYASAQTTTDQKGLYEDNDLVTLGINTTTFGDNAVSLEVSDGDRGSALTAGLELGGSDGLNFSVNGGVGSGAISQFSSRYNVADGHELYGSYTVDPDRTDGARNLLTLGQRRDLGNHLGLFTESQFGKSDSYADIGHVFGLEFDGIENLTFTSTVQFSENNHSGVQFDRQALSLGASLRSDDLKFSSRIEYREDQGLAVHNRQYISSNNLLWRRNDERFWAGRLNLSWTDDELNGGRVARFVELDVGHTYRPVENDRFNLLSKYSYLFDLPSEGQNTFRADERSHLLSVEGLYDLNNRWELAGKLAIRKGEIRMARDSGPWQKFGLRMASVRARYNLTGQWDALAEYRWLQDIEGTNDRHGALLGLYRHVGDNFKIGLGFNFTDFNSDLRIDRYDNRGWFVDFIGKY